MSDTRKRRILGVALSGEEYAALERRAAVSYLKVGTLARQFILGALSFPTGRPVSSIARKGN